MQDAAGSSSYTVIGSVQAGLVSGVGATFLRVSPDGARIAATSATEGTGMPIAHAPGA